MTKQDFLTFIQTQQHWSEVWDLAKLNSWAAGTLGSATLDKLFGAFQSGNTQATTNWILSESGHGQEIPGWQDYKTALKPEIVFLTSAISDLQNRLAQYQSNGGVDPQLITAIQNEITSFSLTLAQYKKSGIV